jgi:hypothetical protein
VTGARAARAQAGEARQTLEVKVLGTNRADIAVFGATASGAVGAVVTVAPGMRNNGPASRWNDIGPAAEATITLPPGTSFLGVEEDLPDNCFATEFLPFEQVKVWRCEVNFYFEAGQEVTFPFPLRINTATPNATGTIVLDKAYADKVNTCNNTAKIIINPTGGTPSASSCTPSATPTAVPTGSAGGGGGEPGLPITGPGAAAIAGSGALIVLIGFGVLMLGRRRRTGIDA